MVKGSHVVESVVPGTGWNHQEWTKTKREREKIISLMTTHIYIQSAKFIKIITSSPVTDEEVFVRV